MSPPPRLTSRALPPYRYRPGGPHPHPERDPGGHLRRVEPDPQTALPPHRWAEQREYLWGIDLFNLGYWWEAHEAWEGLWHKSTEPRQRLFLQGMIQLGAALLKVPTGRTRGLERLTAKAGDKLRRVRDNLPSLSTEEETTSGAKPSPSPTTEPAREAARHYMGLDLTRLLAEIERLRGLLALEIQERSPALEAEPFFLRAQGSAPKDAPPSPGPE